ncbi:helix-turn-helix domain-containing protein [Pseudonocardia broussonetiae]|uniref:Helix-turn-helix domain-containing protein n=1 Tax=Pseudonocardia broussonetiae TaxID=2736640 RepID=A0A6M6JMJ1_9PSEU|nr:helix-turn-helix domain-containing protein [Pseudonocardia broussonetiae]
MRVHDDAPPAGSGPPDSGPPALRIALGGQLRRLREAAGISREAAAGTLRTSPARIDGLELGRELGRGGFTTRDVDDLLTRYGVADDRYRALARRATEPDWWQSYHDLLPGWAETYVGLEQAASRIRTYEVQFVPGLLQTADHARAVIRLVYDHAPEVERRVELRMRRQALLTAPGAPALHAVVDEGALRRTVGGPAVARAQLDHLLALSELPHVRLQVAPFHFGGHAAAGGPFTILGFTEPDLADLVYLEQLTSALYLDAPSDVAHYERVMDRLCTQVEPVGRTGAILASIRAEL